MLSDTRFCRTSFHFDTALLPGNLPQLATQKAIFLLVRRSDIQISVSPKKRMERNPPQICFIISRKTKSISLLNSLAVHLCFGIPDFYGVFLFAPGTVAGARSSKVEDTFVPLWRLLGRLGIYKGIPPPWVSFLHYTSTSYYTIPGIEIFLLSVLPSYLPSQKKDAEAFESLDWHVVKRRPGIGFFGLGILGCRWSRWTRLVKMRHPRCPYYLQTVFGSSQLLHHSQFKSIVP